MAQTLIDLDFNESVVTGPFVGGTIPNEELAFFWPDIVAELNKVKHIWETHWTLDALCQGAMTGRFQVWGFGKASRVNVVIFTEVVTFPANKILYAFIAFGNSIDPMLPLIGATLERFAQECGCTIFEVVGRSGWSKKFAKLKSVGTIMRARIERKGVH